MFRWFGVSKLAAIMFAHIFARRKCAAPGRGRGRTVGYGGPPKTVINPPLPPPPAPRFSSQHLDGPSGCCGMVTVGNVAAAAASRPEGTMRLEARALTE